MSKTLRMNTDVYVPFMSDSVVCVTGVPEVS